MHLGIDAETLEIRAIEVTGNGVGDAPMLPDLLGQIPPTETLLSVRTDGACDTKGCHFLDAKASLREQAAQAVQLSNAIVTAARNSMQNANAAAQLSFTLPVRSMMEWVNHFDDDFGGDALYRKIIVTMEAQTRRPGETCFVAGTLVHTREGLVPIEKIKVGDYVLSKPESGEGELSYQRVLQTFVHENQPLLCVDVDGWTVEERLRAEEAGTALDDGKSIPLVVTPNHPFWVVGKGWVRAEHLDYTTDVLQLGDGSLHHVYSVSKILRTGDENIGFLVGGLVCPIQMGSDNSRAIMFGGNSVKTSYDAADDIVNDAIEWWEVRYSDRMLRAVYNIEVENTHTYFVGSKTLAVWVHNKPADIRGGDVSRALEEANN